MQLWQLQLTNFRNIEHASIEPASGINLIHGENASGKTSLLEAIYFLAYLRSFRSSSLADLIRHDTRELQIFSRIGANSEPSIPLGIRRSTQNLQVRLKEKTVQRAADLAAVFPVIAIHPESYRLITGSPAQRRQFMDWGVFHVEHAFFKAWQDYRKVLTQRNAALKSGQGKRLCDIWNPPLVESAAIIDRSRRKYVDELEPVIVRLAEQIFPGKRISMSYRRGWRDDSSLDDILQEHYLQDRRRGFTQYGTHRAELLLQINGQSVQHAISRGQQKLMVALLKLAQAQHFTISCRKSCTLLYDDLSAELDAGHRCVVLDVLKKMNAQLFISAIERESIDISAWENKKVFHVEQGRISPV